MILAARIAITGNLLIDIVLWVVMVGGILTLAWRDGTKKANKRAEHQGGNPMSEPTCALGHVKQAMECPGCAEAKGSDTTIEWWKWYRSRTSSKAVKAKVNERLAKWAEHAEGAGS